ncbi:hypothetical protein D9M69_526130 [compost metagenome]
MRDLDVGREDRHAQRDGVAGRQQVVLAQAVEQVGHGGGAAFHRVHVELAHEGVGADHFLVDVLAHDDLGQAQHAVGHRVVAAQDGLAHLVDEVAGRQAQLVAHVGHGGLDEAHAGLALVRLGEELEARLDALALRKAAHVRHVDVRALGLGHGKEAELEEAMARGGGQKVRVAAAGVEHQAFTLSCDLDQRILQFERAQAAQLFHVAEIHGVLLG